MNISGGTLLVRSLIKNDVSTAFCVPGESYLDVLNALYDEQQAIKLIVCRHEAGAANMAEAYGKLTGAPGVCFVTRGPGAMHASAGLHTAMQDSTPLVLFVGQVSTTHLDREAFQELDYRRMFGQVAKWVAQIDSAERIPEYVSRAFQTAVSGRPGPVVLALPEDMLVQQVSAELAEARRWETLEAEPNSLAIQRLVGELASANSPIVIVGGGGWTKQIRADITRFCENFKLPVIAEFRCQDYVDNRHPAYIGDLGLATNPALAARVRDSDLIILVGGRLSEALTGGYQLVATPRPAQRMVHIHPHPEELGSVYFADVLIAASISAFARRIAALEPPPTLSWETWTHAARVEYEEFIRPGASEARVDMGKIIDILNTRLAPDAIITNGAGNYTTWLHRHFQYKDFRSQLGPMNGAMGYGLPAAIAAKLLYPERQVICLAGDGCFLMNVQELETAKRYGANIVVIVVSNGAYGTIRAHQEKHYPGRNYGTSLDNPDFVQLAVSFGFHAERVETHAVFDAALDRALAANAPALIELPTEIEFLSAQSRLSTVRGISGSNDR